MAVSITSGIRVRSDWGCTSASLRLSVLLTAALVGGVSAASAAESMNVLFIAADDLRCDLGCYGHPLVKTPHIDRLAQRGVAFRHAYCQQALCNPSRASLLTGRRPDALRLWNLENHFRDVLPDVVTLPQHFKRHGYFTQNIGKIFHNWRTEIEGDPQSWSVPAVMHYARHGDDHPQVDGSLPPNQASDPKCERRDVPDRAYFDGRIADQAVEALAQRKRAGEPFFLAVGFWKPHSPFNAPARYWDLYDRDDIDLPPNAAWPHDAPRAAWHNSREILGDPPRTLSTAAVRELRHGYLAAISYLDAQVGKVIDALDREGLSDKTVIVFWSDHGFHLGEHTLWAKTSNFELDARVPLIITVPAAAAAGRTTDALAELLDLYPTLTELCDLPTPDALQGESLAPLLRDPDGEVKSAAFTQHPRPAYYGKRMDAMGYSMRTGRFRYTEWRRAEDGRVLARELYDHRTDAAEMVNLVDRPAFAETTEALRRQMRDTMIPPQPAHR